jgi:putative membrane protein
MKRDPVTTSINDANGDQASLPVIASRSIFGGILMGLANLVPGISGGTMLLAAGIYPAFIDSLANVTRLKFSFRALLVLGLVGIAAGLGVLVFAGTLKTLVVEQRWIMYSLFIGLTLGGIPVVWKMVSEKGSRLFSPAAVAFLAMVALAVAQYMGVVGSSGSNFLTLLAAGLAGASAMILPGLSGGYILLLMGQYVPILGAVHDFKDALTARDLSAAMTPALSVLLPVGIGVLVGIVLVGNLLKWLFNRYQTQTLGVLLGLLLGSTVGLFPFQNVRKPEPGDVIKAQVVTIENVAEFKEKDWPVEYFRPSAFHLASAFGLAGIGFAITMGVSLLGKDKDQSEE